MSPGAQLQSINPRNIDFSHVSSLSNAVYTITGTYKRVEVVVRVYLDIFGARCPTSTGFRVRIERNQYEVCSRPRFQKFYGVRFRGCDVTGKMIGLIVGLFGQLGESSIDASLLLLR